MKRAMCALAAAMILCGGLVVASVAPAKAECTTQGALALAVAEMLKLNIVSEAAAVDALTALGIQPDGGWQPAECLTPEATAQVKTAYAQALTSPGGQKVLVPDALERALLALRPLDRQYPHVSPAKP